MKYYFEAERKDEVQAAEISANSLAEGSRIFQAYLAGLNWGPPQYKFEMTSASKSRRRGVTYQELDL
jgi:hypothetical protein